MENSRKTYRRDFSGINPRALNATDNASLFEFVQTQGTAWEHWLSADGVREYMARDDYQSLYDKAPASIRNANVTEEEKAAAIWLMCRCACTGNGQSHELNWDLYFSAPLENES